MQLLGDLLPELGDQPKPSDLSRVILEVHQEFGDPLGVIPNVEPTGTHERYAEAQRGDPRTSLPAFRSCSSNLREHRRGGA